MTSEATASEQSASDRSAPLKGIVVADFSRVLAGPLASMLLGDFGATVIKVERPDRGDDSRAWGPPFIGEGAGDSTYYLSVNRNKRSLKLDLHDPADVLVAHKLIRNSDVLIENFRPGTMERLGFGYEDLVADNPGLIYSSISGFGREAGAGLPGYDFLAQASGGLMSLTGEVDGEPMKTGVAVADIATGLFSAIGIFAAIVERVASGRGQKVETNLLQSVLGLLANHASGYLVGDIVSSRQGNAHVSISPYETIRASDGEIVVAIGNDRQFEAMCKTLDISEVAADPRFVVNSARVKNRKTLHQILEERISQYRVDDWILAFAKVGVPCGRVNSVDRAFAFAEELGLSAVYRHLADGTKAVAQVADPITLSETPATYRMPPPTLGEHDTEIREWISSLTR